MVRADWRPTGRRATARSPAREDASCHELFSLSQRRCCCARRPELSLPTKTDWSRARSGALSPGLWSAVRSGRSWAASEALRSETRSPITEGTIAATPTSLIVTTATTTINTDRSTAPSGFVRRPGGDRLHGTGSREAPADRGVRARSGSSLSRRDPDGTRCDRGAVGLRRRLGELERPGGGLGYRAFDPPPFAWLAGAASLASLYLVILILTTQTRRRPSDPALELLNLELTILSEQKIAKVVALLEELRQDSPHLHDRIDEWPRRCPSRRTLSR